MKAKKTVANLHLTDQQIATINELRSDITFQTWKKVISILTESEARTVSWVSLTLNSLIDVSKIGSFKLPLSGRLSLVYQKFYQEAYQLGGQFVAEGVDGATVLYAGRPNVESRARARLASSRIIMKIEGDLKWEWERSITRRPDKPMLVYRTQYVFAKIGGWEPPDGPTY